MALSRWENPARAIPVLIIRGGPGDMEEGGNLARTIPTSNPDPDQEQGGLSVWCGVNRQRAVLIINSSNKSENQKEKTNSTLNHSHAVV